MSGTVWPQVVLSNASGVPYDTGTPLPVTGSISATSAATATAAAPSYIEGAASALSQNLSGDARVIAKQSGTWTVTGTFWQATQPVSLAALPALTAGAAVIGSLTANQSVNAAQVNGVTPLMGNGVTGTGSLRVTIASDNTAYSVNAVQSGTWNIGTVTTLTGITNALPAGTNLMGKVGIDQTTAGTTNGVVQNATSATGGISTTTRLLSAAATTNATSAKASAGRLYSIQGYNAATTVRYLKLYNKASAPTVGTDTPVKTLALPPGVGFAFDWPVGYSFVTGIAFALTTGSADADTGALTAADVVGLNLDYA